MNGVVFISLFVLIFSATLFNQSFSIRDSYVNDNHPIVQPNNFSPLFPCLWFINTFLQPLLNFPPFFSSPSPPEPIDSPSDDRRFDECQQPFENNFDMKCYEEMLKSFSSHKVLLQSDCCRRLMLIPDYCFKEVLFPSNEDVTSKFRGYCSKKLAATPST